MNLSHNADFSQLLTNLKYTSVCDRLKLVHGKELFKREFHNLRKNLWKINNKEASVTHQTNSKPVSNKNK